MKRWEKLPRVKTRKKKIKKNKEKKRKEKSVPLCS
jgi:hypothetical protein